MNRKNHKKFRRRKKFVRNYLQTRGFQYLRSGKGRSVWGNGRIVIKVPNDPYTYQQNVHERRAWDRSRDPRYAACRLLKIYKIDCLMMEQLTVEKDSDDHYPLEDLPSWTMKLDCQQCGWDHDGNLKAFDYPEDPLDPDFDKYNYHDHDELVEIAQLRKQYRKGE